MTSVMFSTMIVSDDFRISVMISQIFREVVTIVFRERFAWNDHYYCNIFKKISIFLKTCFWSTIFLLFTCFWSITCCVYILALKIDFEVILSMVSVMISWWFRENCKNSEISCENTPVFRKWFTPRVLPYLKTINIKTKTAPFLKEIIYDFLWFNCFLIISIYFTVSNVAMLNKDKKISCV